MSIILREIYSTDTVSDLIDKLNYNFDQIILNGGGAPGPQGNVGIGLQGIAGKDGSTWLYGSTHPSLIATPYKTNDYYILTNDTTFGIDTFESGDVFNYDGVSWVYTGLNITGEQGTDTSSTIGVFVQNPNINIVNMISTATYTSGSESIYKPVIIGPPQDQNGKYILDAGSLLANDSNAIIYEQSPNSNSELKLFSGPLDINGSGIYSPILIASAPALTSIRRYTGIPSNLTGDSVSDLIISNNSGGFIKTTADQIYLESNYFNIGGTSSRIYIELNDSVNDSNIKLNTNTKLNIYVLDANNPAKAKMTFDDADISLNGTNYNSTFTNSTVISQTSVMRFNTLDLRNNINTSDTIQFSIANSNTRTLRIKTAIYTSSLHEYTLPNVTGYLLTNNSILTSNGISKLDNSLLVSTNNTLSLSLDLAYTDNRYYSKNGDALLDISVTSLNSYTKSGFVHIDGINPSAPIANTNGYQVSIFKFGNNVLQKATSMDNGNDFIRYSNNDGITWSLWKTSDPFKIGTIFPLGDTLAVASFNSATGLGTGDWVGWAICDGRNGTIDARGRVLLGMAHPAYTAGNIEASNITYHTLGNTGGQSNVLLTDLQSGLPSHIHGLNDPGHRHATDIRVIGSEVVEDGGGASVADFGSFVQLSSFNQTGITVQSSTPLNAAEGHENRQPFIVIQYVQKIV